jgi:hypothetical protein
VIARTQQEPFGHTAGPRTVVWGRRELFQATCTCGWVGRLWRKRQAAQGEAAQHVLVEYLATFAPEER